MDLIGHHEGVATSRNFFTNLLMKDRGGFLTSPLYDCITCLDHCGLFLFGLVQVFDAPKGSFCLAVLDLVRIDTPFVQGITELTEVLRG
jgi:hypothetical protein